MNIKPTHRIKERWRAILVCLLFAQSICIHASSVWQQIKTNTKPTPQQSEQFTDFFNFVMMHNNLSSGSINTSRLLTDGWPALMTEINKINDEKLNLTQDFLNQTLKQPKKNVSNLVQLPHNSRINLLNLSELIKQSTYSASNTVNPLMFQSAITASKFIELPTPNIATNPDDNEKEELTKHWAKIAHNSIIYSNFANSIFNRKPTADLGEKISYLQGASNYPQKNISVFSATKYMNQYRIVKHNSATATPEWITTNESLHSPISQARQRLYQLVDTNKALHAMIIQKERKLVSNNLLLMQLLFTARDMISATSVDTTDVEQDMPSEPTIPTSKGSGQQEPPPPPPREQPPGRSTGCFIATEIYGPASKEVTYLQKFRDQYLTTNKPGKLFIDNYYRYSPKLVKIVEKKPHYRQFTRDHLNYFIDVVKSVEPILKKRANK